MKIIYLQGIGRTCSTAMRCFYATAFAGVFAAFGGGMLWFGYQMGLEDVEFPEHQLVAALKQSFESERELLQETRSDAQSQVDALAVRVGQLQSRLLRLDALGERLVDMGHLDKGEFSFSEEPALGGPEGSEAEQEGSALSGLLSELQHLEEKIASREEQLGLLEDLIMHSKLDQTLHPAGRPIKKGWISSYFGMRNDPFTGKRTMHKGMDFAGKEGSEVVAVAAGVVTWVGDKYGYGQLVEINHGKGYVTRYGHNKKALVEIGDRVKQGQVIATMGSSGRSTGPHVHFEVLLNDRVVNPSKYVRAKRSKDQA
jgi:murein DD-endopeptidase MepM/ murein hydrolase activator NlpD